MAVSTSSLCRRRSEVFREVGMSEAWWWRGWSSVVCRSLLEQPSARTAIKNQPQHAWGAALALLSSTPHLAQHSEGRLAERADPSSSACLSLEQSGSPGKSNRSSSPNRFKGADRSVQEASACWRGVCGEKKGEKRGERGGTTRCWTGQVDGQWSRRLVTALPYYNRSREGGHQARSLWLACQLLCTAGGHGFCW